MHGDHLHHDHGSHEHHAQDEALQPEGKHLDVHDAAGEHHHGDGHDHGHGHEPSRGIRGLLSDFFRPHSHDAADSVDDALEGSLEGTKAVVISLVGLGLTAALQLAVAVLSGSVGLLADTIHNFADASTAIPLWLAFSVGRRPPTHRYTYGFGRAEDLAGVFVVAMIAASAAIAAWQSFERLTHPRPLTHLGWVAAAAVLGCVGNEFVARYRIRAGKRIGSAALVADGYHARTDGLTSPAVLIGVAGAWLGWSQADAVVGLGITAAILFVLRDAAVQIWRRLMDAVDPDVLDQLESAARPVAGVQAVSSVRVRWIGHNMHAEALLVVNGELTVAQAHAVGEAARHAMLHAVPKLAGVTVHVDPSSGSGRDPHSDLAHHDTKAPAGLR